MASTPTEEQLAQRLAELVKNYNGKALPGESQDNIDLMALAYGFISWIGQRDDSQEWSEEDQDNFFSFVVLIYDLGLQAGAARAALNDTFRDLNLD